MPELRGQSARQRALATYRMTVMDRLEWDLHNIIELTGRIPEEWHDLAIRPSEAPQEKVP